MSLKCKFALFFLSEAKGQINNKRPKIKVILIIVVVTFFKGLTAFVILIVSYDPSSVGYHAPSEIAWTLFHSSHVVVIK